jgi:hypothetical protein
MAARPDRQTNRDTRPVLVLKLIALGAAAAVLGIGAYSVWHARRSRPVPVAAAFTRVGGLNSIQTAIDAARFWPNPPQTIVEIPANASQPVMLEAARCAMANDAPLLLTSANRKQQLPVAAINNRWLRIAQADGYAPPRILNQGDLASCVTVVHLKGLSFLKVPSQRFLIRLLPTVPAPRKLARFVVFAAPITPRHLPDVAVGLALAAHLAFAHGEQVSFVVVQPYLEADPLLEQQLRDQAQPVTGGVVLGQTPTVPEDTLTLLRQLLRTPGRQNFLDQIQTTLQNFGAVIAAMLALGGGAAAAAVAEPLIIQVPELFGNQEARRRRRARRPLARLRRARRRQDWRQRARLRLARLLHKIRLPRLLHKMREIILTRPPRPWRKSPAEPDWFAALGDEQQLEVTFWLRSGWVVTGTMNKEDRASARTSRLCRLDEPELLAKPANYTQGQPGWDQPLACLLVPVEDIELIGAKDQNQANAAQKRAPDQSPATSV